MTSVRACFIKNIDFSSYQEMRMKISNSLLLCEDVKINGISQ